MIEAIRRRRSCRVYKNKAVEDAKLNEILEAAQYAPTSKDWRGWEFIVVKDVQIKNQLVSIARQRFTLSAPVFIVPIIDTDSSVCPIEEIAIASTYIMLQAKDCGLDSIWLEVTEPEEKGFKEILRVPERYLIINMLLIGYSDETLPPHNEEEVDRSKIHIDVFPQEY